MKKLTKKEMAGEIIYLSNEKLSGNTLIKLTWDQLDSKLTALKIMNTTKNEEKKMSELKMKEGFIIGAKDVVQHKWGKMIKAAPAKDAVAAVEGVKAVEAAAAVKANKKEGIEAVKAVKAVTGVKAIKAVEAAPARLASTEMYIRCKTEEIAAEFMARMAAEGLEANYGGNATPEDDFFIVSYSHEDIKVVRAAMKKAKAKDGYNAAGLATLKAEAKAAAKAEKAAEKKAEPKKEAPKVEEKTDTDEEDGAWPGTFE